MMYTKMDLTEEWLDRQTQRQEDEGFCQEPIFRGVSIDNMPQKIQYKLLRFMVIQELKRLDII